MPPPKAKGKAEPKGKAKAEPKAKVEPNAKAEPKGKAQAAEKEEEEAAAEARAKDEPTGEQTDAPAQPAKADAAGSTQRPPAGSAAAAAKALSSGVALPGQAAPHALPPEATGSGGSAGRAVGGSAGGAAASAPEGQDAAAAPTAEGEAVAPPPASPAEKAAVLKERTPDPWEAFGEAEALRMISEESWEVLEMDDLEALGEGSSSPSARQVLAKDAELKKFEANPEVEQAAFSLDLSGNDIERADRLPALWLRHVVLANNPLDSLDGLGELLPRLLAIDLSFVDLSALLGGWKALQRCPALRVLVAEGASVSSFDNMELMPQLRTLELIENDVEEVSEVATLASKCPGLERLDLRDNLVATAPGYIKQVQKHLPTLAWHNNSTTGKKQTAPRRDQVTYAETVNAAVHAVDGLCKNEHCSCIEGNPCLDRATCLDWENREKVAAAARKRKGLRDDFGTQL